MKLTGQCCCGAVRYTFEGHPTTSFFCHCKDCQRSSGSLLHHGVMVRRKDLQVVGELARYTSKSDTGREITRRFCPTCGSGVLNELELAPNQVVLRAGTLDGDGAPHPTFEVYTRSRSRWLSPQPGLLSFDTDASGDPTPLLWKERE